MRKQLVVARWLPAQASPSAVGIDLNQEQPGLAIEMLARGLGNLRRRGKMDEAVPGIVGAAAVHALPLGLAPGRSRTDFVDPAHQSSDSKVRSSLRAPDANLRIMGTFCFNAGAADRVQRFQRGLHRWILPQLEIGRTGSGVRWCLLAWDSPEFPHLRRPYRRHRRTSRAALRRGPADCEIRRLEVIIPKF